MLRGIYQNANGGLRKQNGHYQQSAPADSAPYLKQFLWTACYTDNTGDLRIQTKGVSTLSTVQIITSDYLRPGTWRFTLKLNSNTILPPDFGLYALGLSGYVSPFQIYVTPIYDRNGTLYQGPQTYLTPNVSAVNNVSPVYLNNDEYYPNPVNGTRIDHSGISYNYTFPDALYGYPVVAGIVGYRGCAEIGRRDEKFDEKLHFCIDVAGVKL